MTISLGEVEDVVKRLIAKIAGLREITEEAFDIATLLPLFGGCGCRIPTGAYADAAFWGNYVTNWKRIHSARVM